MHSLKAFAKSTLGEIKDALVEAVGDDDDEEDVPSSPVQTHPGINAEQPVLKGNGGTDVAESLRNLSGNRESISANLPELAAVESPESEAARMEFQAVQGSPYLESILSQLDSEKAARAKEWNKGSLSIPEIAALSCWTLRQLFPLVPATQLTNQGQSETQRLLTSFSDRYEALLMEHTALQRKARELSHANTELARSAQQTESWKSAHGTAIARLEELSSENAELKERIRSSWANLNSDQDQSRDQLVRKVAQKDAEIRGLTEAMERLQEVVDDQSSLATKCWNLERELREAKEARETVDPMSVAIKPDDEAWRRETQTRQGSQESHEHLLARCQHAEKELSDTSAALEVLLEEKSKRIEDQEHLVDRRLVTSMLALYHDHVSSGQRALADQVLTQALHILGGVPEETQRSRQQLKEAAAAAEARLAEPLGNAFLDFLEKETELEMGHAGPVGPVGHAPTQTHPTPTVPGGKNPPAPNGSASLTVSNQLHQLPPVAPPQVPLPSLK